MHRSKGSIKIVQALTPYLEAKLQEEAFTGPNLF